MGAVKVALILGHGPRIVDGWGSGTNVPPFCGIRKCAQRKNVEICPFCDEYPCNRIEMLAKGYSTLIASGRRMKDIGIEAWIAEQLERAKTGFAYVDIRCPPYSIPEE